MRSWLERRLDSVSTVYAACAASITIGLVFVFVWAPHPWGWQGIDQYHELARALARGEPFGTTDVPWGYAYYVAACYAAFGHVPWVPLVGQVLVNAAVPLLLYHLVGHVADRRTAVLSALITGVFSFNTIYASTQSSDSLCTAGFLAMVLCFVRGARTGRLRDFAVSGLLAGAVPQFRPNLILFPFVLGVVYLLLRPRARRKLLHVAVFLAIVAAALAPWTLRNYRLTGMFLPTSTHGGVQLWYGTLQVGRYLESRAHNPRSAFEPAAFDYTSLAGQPIVVSAALRRCESWDRAATSLVYWTDRDATRRTLDMRRLADGSLQVEVPGQPSPTALSYYLETRWPSQGSDALVVRTDPAVFFVASEHLGDLDTRGQVLDVFDLIRLLRFLAWSEPLPPIQVLDLDGSGTVTDADVELAVRTLTDPDGSTGGMALVSSVERTPFSVRLRLMDGSVFEVPQTWSRRVTDVEVQGPLATMLVYQRRFVTAPGRRDAADACRSIDRVDVNGVFYRKEPHLMRRYTALAFDNIARDPVAFAAAAVYRLARLFVIRGTDDRWVAQQFSAARFVYGAGTVLSITYALLATAGVVIAWRRRYPIGLLVLPILYVPLTISLVLTNMRYTVTVQPFLFAFIAVAMMAWVGRPDQPADLREDSAARRAGAE